MAKQTGMFIWDLFLTLWIVAGFIYIGILEFDRGSKDTGDEAQEKLQHIVVTMMIYVGILIVLGIPFIFIANRKHYMPFMIRWLDKTPRLRYI